MFIYVCGVDHACSQECYFLFLSCLVVGWGGVWCVEWSGVEWCGVVSFDVFISMHIATPLHYLSRSSFLLLAAYCHL